jgi:hypothetical protein
MIAEFGFTSSRLIAARGNRFRYASSNAASLGLSEGLVVRADGELLGTYYPGDSIALPRSIDHWDITAASGAVGTVQIGHGAIESSRITGNVKIIDNGAELTMAGKQFLGAAAQAADAAKCSIVGIHATSVAFAIRSIAVTSDVSGAITILPATGTPADTPVNKGGVTPKVWGQVNDGRIVRWGGLCAATNPTAVELPGKVVNATTTFAIQAGGVREVTLRTPIVVPVGMGFYMVSPVINCGIVANWEIEVLG